MTTSLPDWQQRILQTLATRFPALIAPRTETSHKGSYGSIAIVGGSEGMSGALCLAASAALLMGCGKSYAVFAQPALPFAMIPGCPEIMLKTGEQLSGIEPLSVIAVGCGLGTDEYSQTIFAHTLTLAEQHRAPLIVDADGLNLLAQYERLTTDFQRLTGVKILTPHPAEAARLLHTDTTTIQQSREDSARILAERYHAWIVLKGHRSVIGSPQGEITINDSGNAGLATAGSGDVLTGMIAGLLSGLGSIENTLPAAVWLHGAAAEWLGNGQALSGLLAGEIAPAAREIRHQAMLIALNAINKA